MCGYRGELIQATADGQGNQFERPFTYVVIVLLLAINFSQIQQLQEALKSFDALYIIPITQVCLVLWRVTMMQ